MGIKKLLEGPCKSFMDQLKNQGDTMLDEKLLAVKIQRSATTLEAQYKFPFIRYAKIMAPQKVKAIYDYTGQHTDELNFKRGDVITITQPPEDGWYEGTLRGVTGWFPANHVIDHHDDNPAEQGLSVQNDENRTTVIANIIETEAEFVKDLDTFINSTLQPVWRMFGENYDLINRNLELILETHRTLLSGLRAESSQNVGKIGKIFLVVFSRLQGAHSNYCALHPKIIKSLMNSDSSNVSNNNSSVNYTNLTIGLSAPFKRLEKYEILLEELTRHTAENHPDRGDCQRSCSLFRELVVEMTNVRRQKDVETEILNANIRNWDGPPISTYGDARITCPVRGYWADRWKDFYLVAFDSAILLVSLFDSNEFQLDHKFPLDRTTISTSDKANSLEMQHATTKLVVTFHSTEDIDKIRGRVDVYSTVQKRSSAKSLDNSVLLRANGSRPVTPDNRPNTAPKSWVRISRPTSPAPLPPANLRQTRSISSHRVTLAVDKIRGVLPHRRTKKPLQKDPNPGLKRGSSARKNKKDLPLPIQFEERPSSPSQYERDLQILRVVEAFASISKKPRIPVGGVTTTSFIGFNSLPSVRVSTVTAHSVSPMEVECTRSTSISPGIPGEQLSLRSLQNDVALLKEQMAKLQADLQEERRQRKTLQEQLNTLTTNNRL